MAKYYGKIGFAKSIETSPGIFEEHITTYNYYGDVINNSRHYQVSDNINANINLNNVISVISDAYLDSNIPYICYVEYMGNKWTVSNVTIQRPRIILTLGGLYNE